MYPSRSITSEDAMYPPPGSFKYTTPKPVRNGSARRHPDDDIKCDTISNCPWACYSGPIFRLRFWKFVTLFVLVVTTGHFSTVVMFRRGTQPLFVVKYDNTAGKMHSPLVINKIYKDLNGIYQTHHRKVNNLLSPRKVSTVEARARKYTNTTNLTSNAQENLLRINSKLISNNLNLSRKSFSNPSKHNDSKFEENEFKLKASKVSKKEILKIGSREKKYNSSFEVENSDSSLKLCPPIPPNLKGPVKVNLNNVPSLEVQEQSHDELSAGGRFRPPECRSRHKVAVIIPFRDRATHLAVFLYNLLPFLQRQQIDFAIYIVEQAGKKKFNRAMLMNVGSIEALKLYPYNCFIFHDIDLIPEDDRNLYTCPEQPRHMSVAINTMKYKLPYNDIFGGVSAMTVPQFTTVNGFSNKFWGWGGEDDDMSNRIKFRQFYISRYPANVARYTMMSHKKDSPNPQRYKYLNEGKKRYSTDGLNSVKYNMLEIQLRKLYTWFYVELLKS